MNKLFYGQNQESKTIFSLRDRNESQTRQQQSESIIMYCTEFYAVLWLLLLLYLVHNILT